MIYFFQISFYFIIYKVNKQYEYMYINIFIDYILSRKDIKLRQTVYKYFRLYLFIDKIVLLISLDKKL